MASLMQPTEVLVPKTEPGVTLEKPEPGEGGFECEFVEKPPSVIQTECPVCLLVLREPYQVICCGKSFCRVCIGKIKTEHQPCPTCQETDIQYFPNKGLQQPLYGLKVRCTRQKEGCKWTGELGKLDNHLNVDPNQLEGCLYTVIKCRYHFAGCDTILPRKDMQVHLQEKTQYHITLLEKKYNTISREHKHFQTSVQSQFPTPPVTLTMTEFKYRSQEKQQWTSPPFYTALRGYKMYLKVDVGLRTPLSIQLCMMKGEFDDTLGWRNSFPPIEVTIEVVSQVSWEPNKSVSIEVIDITNRRPHQYVQNDSSFITDESSALIQPEDMYMFVKDDCVQFCISKINTQDIYINYAKCLL